jgi:hypothetical protein
MSPSTTTQEEVMSQPFPTQHPAVVLRSHFKLVQALLAIAMAAVVALSVAVVILADDEGEVLSSGATAEKAAALPNAAVHSHPLGRASTAEGVRYDGGPEEGTRSIIVVPQAPAARYDGGPDEGSAAISQPTPGPAPERTTDDGADEVSLPIPQGPGGPR